MFRDPVIERMKWTTMAIPIPLKDRLAKLKIIKDENYYSVIVRHLKGINISDDTKTKLYNRKISVEETDDQLINRLILIHDNYASLVAKHGESKIRKMMAYG